MRSFLGKEENQVFHGQSILIIVKQKRRLLSYLRIPFPIVKIILELE